MQPRDVPGVVALQRDAFPPPFSEDLHWDPEHIERHLAIFPEGQWVAVSGDWVVGSCSNSLIGERVWQRHSSWYETVGGPDLDGFDPNGSTLYGLDITVHPEFRRRGMGRCFYDIRMEYVRENGLARFGTGCRIPDLQSFLAKNPGRAPDDYVKSVLTGEAHDRVLTPLLRLNMHFLQLIENYMEDEESLNFGALLERTA